MRPLLFIALALGASLLCRAADSSYASKISLGLTNGWLSNSGSAGGSSISIGGLDLSGSLYLSGKLAVGMGYHLDFDYSTKGMPLSGIDLFTRWYFSGQGTRSTASDGWATTERHDAISFYLGAGISREDYYLGSHQLSTDTEPPTGSSFNVHGALGMDYALSRNAELTAELDRGLLTFAAVDDRFRITATQLMVGVNYLW